MILSIVSSPIPSSIMDSPQWFQGRGIPPERVGSDGKYDHAGLANRVKLALELEWAASADGLRVSQRGQVVILAGQVESLELLQKMIDRSLTVEGAAFIEYIGVRFAMTHCSIEAA